MVSDNCILILVFILIPIAVNSDNNWWGNLKSNNAKDTKTALVTIVDKVERLEEYKLGLETVNCYANLRKYAHKVIILEDSGQPTNIQLDDDATIVLPSVHNMSHLCEQKMFMYRRHCVLAHYMSQNSDKFDLVVFLDADIGVVNPNRTIDEYLPRDEKFIPSTPYMVFYNRLYVHEIMAGSYIARNVEYSRQFLHYWANLSYVEPYYPGTDNGAIHLVFMEMFNPTVETKQKCTRYRNESTTYDGLFKFEACVRQHFGLNETRYSAYGRTDEDMGKVIGFVALAPFGKSWCRDAGVTESRFSSGDFMFHQWKQTAMNKPQPGNKPGTWVYPFHVKNVSKKCQNRFNMQKCLGGSMEPWVPNEGLLVEEAKIDEELGVWIKNLNDGYKNNLKKLGIQDPPGTDSIQSNSTHKGIDEHSSTMPLSSIVVVYLIYATFTSIATTQLWMKNYEIVV
ncbi:hypothetical protein DdX_15286 [Ditylenchus destructor]|uniref:Uncharacterized protein n=1 Tax=Ditylenchus destructor TaxID=166010 RepID=A0AAD4MPR4_9BILA|nr:hypothetical protein DdX_15286 [Ditylenchus destructor]